MPACPACGAETVPDARFCMMCAAPLPAPSAPAVPPAPPSVTSPPPSAPPPAVPERPRPRRRPDLLGPIGAGVFFITLGIVLAANPALPSQLGQWLAQIGSQGPFHRPPDGVIGSAALLFAIGGVVGLGLAALRFQLERRRWRAFMDALGALATLGFSALLYLYAGRSISGLAGIGGAIVMVGAMIIVGVLVGITRSERWWRFGPEPPS